MLFDPLEEEFDVPAGLVKLDDGEGGKVEVIGDEDISSAALQVVEADAA